MLISLVVFDDFTDLDVFLMWDLFNRVQHPRWKVRLIGDSAHHRSRTDIPIPMHGSLELATESDAVMFVSGPGSREKLKDTQFLASLKLDPERQLIGSICSGSLLLAALGLLNGKRATTHPSVRHLLQEFADVRVVDRPFVCNGNVATAAGCLAAQQLVAWVVERLVSKEESDRVLESIQPVGSSAFIPAHMAMQREQHVLRRADW